MNWSIVDFVSALSLFVYSATLVIAWVELLVMYSISEVRLPTNFEKYFSIALRLVIRALVESETFATVESMVVLVVERCVFIASILPVRVGRFCEV